MVTRQQYKKFIQCARKENQFLLKDLLELYKIKSTNMSLQYQKMSIDKLEGIVT